MNIWLTPCVLIILGELCEGSHNESVKFSTDVCRPLASWFRGLEVSTQLKFYMIVILQLWVWFYAQNCTSRWGCTNDGYSGTVTSFVHLTVLCLMHSRMGLPSWLPGHPTCSLLLGSFAPSDPFLQLVLSQFILLFVQPAAWRMDDAGQVSKALSNTQKLMYGPEASWCGLAYFIFFRTYFLWHRCYLKLRSHSLVILGSCYFWHVFLIQNVRNNLWMLLIKTETQGM